MINSNKRIAFILWPIYKHYKKLSTININKPILCNNHDSVFTVNSEKKLRQKCHFARRSTHRQTSANLSLSSSSFFQKKNEKNIINSLISFSAYNPINVCVYVCATSLSSFKKEMMLLGLERQHRRA